MICDPSFTYFQPWFYNHQYSLRCELGIGETNRVYMKNAFTRALQIFDIIFQGKPDAMMFDHYIDDDTSYNKFNIKNILKVHKEEYSFLSEHYKLYPHKIIKDIPFDPDLEDTVRRNRIICYPGDKGFDHRNRIKEQINGKGFTVSYISFENECIFSVYDDRGCDIVFATKEKLKEFFEKLKPYLLKYDLEAMKQKISD